jgi:phosphoribosylaminoimidazolecarboxamide formyltransferase/IMP cyclohydrolase
VDAETVEAVTGQFLEVLIAPSFTEEAKAIIAAKKNVRVLEIPLETGANRYELKRVGGGVLVQTPDIRNVALDELRVVTKRQPTRRKCPICCSPGAWPSSSNPTPSCSAITARPPVSALAR